MSRSQLLALALALVAGCSPRPETPDPDAPAGRVQPAAAYGAVNALDPNGPPIPDPPVAASRDGVLELTLTAAPAVVTVAGRTFRSNVYNGSYIPPVLRVWRGDDVRITFINAVDSADILIDEPQPSNLHYHGMAISPLEPADNIYISIPLRAAAPGDTVMTEDGGHAAGLAKSSPVYEYRWSVPANHPQGPHWYHPHRHHFAEPQVLSGMSGMLLVEGMVQEQFPELAGARRRILVLKDIILPGDADTLPHTKTINGILGGTIRMAPGAVEIWEIGNVGADAYFDLTVDGHRVWVLTRDGNILERPEPALNIFLPPASRATVAIQAGAGDSTAYARSRSIPARWVTPTRTCCSPRSSWRAHPSTTGPWPTGSRARPRIPPPYTPGSTRYAPRRSRAAAASSTPRPRTAKPSS